MIATGVAVLVLVLSGCSPGNGKFVAVSAADGGTVLAQLCAGGGNVYGISISEAKDLDIRWGADGPGLGWISTPLFVAPPTWQADEENTLLGLAPGHRYSVRVMISGSTTASYSSLDISPADISALHPGEVLAADGEGGFTVMTEQEFRNRAKAAC